MTPDEIKAKSATLAELYAAASLGKIIQRLAGETFSIWTPCDYSAFPTIRSDLSKWRIKPEPQRIWISGTAWTDSPVIAAALREVGQEAREFVEVIP